MVVVALRLPVGGERIDDLAGEGELLLVALARPLEDAVDRGLGTTSSAKRIVDIASAPPTGRMAARYSVRRITTEPMPARC